MARLQGLLALFLLCACSAPPAPSPPVFPPRIGRFERSDDVMIGRRAVTGAYQMMIGEQAIIATVQRRRVGAIQSLLPSLDLASALPPEILPAELTRSLAQVRRFYPEAAATPADPVFVVRDGRLRQGVHSIVTFSPEQGPEQAEAGTPVPQRMDINLLCCTAAREVVEIRFRSPAGLSAELDEAAFLRDFPWSAADPDPS